MTRFIPVVFGALMGMMMLWMIHNGGGEFAIGFVLAHVLIGLIAVAALFVTVRFGLAHRFALLQKLHRPRMSHILPMMGGAAGVATLTCLACAAGLMGMM